MHKEKGYKQVADWHDVCAEYHTLARDTFHIWCLNSHPRSGPIYQLMRAKRAQFKSAVRKCKEVGEQKESDRLAQKLLRGDSDNFWKEIKRINTRNKLGMSRLQNSATEYSNSKNRFDDEYSLFFNLPVNFFNYRSQATILSEMQPSTQHKSSLCEHKPLQNYSFVIL